MQRAIPITNPTNPHVPGSGVAAAPPAAVGKYAIGALAGIGRHGGVVAIGKSGVFAVSGVFETVGVSPPSGALQGNGNQGDGVYGVSLQLGGSCASSPVGR